MILDGNSRLAACTALEIEPKIKPWDGECGSPVAFVISQNIRRRHLSPSKRAWLISQLATFKRGDTAVQRDQKAEENDGVARTTPLTISEAAAVAGVDPSVVSNAKIIRERGSPEEKEAAAKGEAGLRTTAEKIRARNPKPTRH